MKLVPLSSGKVGDRGRTSQDNRQQSCRLMPAWCDSVCAFLTRKVLMPLVIS